MVKLKMINRHGDISFESETLGILVGILIGKNSMVAKITGHEATYFSTDNTGSMLIHQVFRGEEGFISRNKDYQS